jgi:aryl-alcohol dehydrogenase-like predicted oxidoreductase
MTSTILGATSLNQLKENVESFSLELSDEILDEIEQIHLSVMNPAP